MGDDGLYDEDPLVVARRTHYGKYQGHPDGRCCLACESETSERHTHITFPCPVVTENQCNFEEPGEYRCIQVQHAGNRHLVESRWGSRMVVWIEDD